VFAKGELLQVVVLAIMIGIGILAVSEGRHTNTFPRAKPGHVHPIKVSPLAS